MATISWRKGGKFSKKHQEGAVAYLIEKIKMPKMDKTGNAIRDAAGEIVMEWVPKRWSLNTDLPEVAQHEWHKYEINKARKASGLPVEDKGWASTKAEYIRVRKTDVAESTVVKDEYILTLFEKLVRPASVSTVTPQNIESFKQERSGKVEEGTLITELWGLAAFFQWAKKMEYIDKNPFDKVEIKKRPKRIPEFFLHEEVKKIFDMAASYKTSPDARYDTSVVEDMEILAKWFYYMGPRLSETILQRIEWINMEGRFAKVRGEKDGEDRIVDIPEEFYPDMQTYLAARPKSGLLFQNKRTKGPLAATTIQKALARLCKKVGLKGYPHKMRHSLGRHLILAGVDKSAVQEILGHASGQTTQIYTGGMREYKKQGMDRIKVQK